MQTADITPPPQPTAPLAPVAPGVTITTVGPNGTIRTISGDQVQAIETSPDIALPPSMEGPSWWMTEKALSLAMVGTFLVLLPMSIAMAIRMIRRPMRDQNQ